MPKRTPPHPDYPHGDRAGYQRLQQQYLLALLLAEHLGFRLARIQIESSENRDQARRHNELGHHVWMLRLLQDQVEGDAAPPPHIEELLPQARAAFDTLIARPDSSAGREPQSPGREEGHGP
jgi:hypothetical protein